MAVADVKYCFEDSVYRKILFSPLKKLGFVPEKQTEIFVSAIPTWATVYDLARFFEQVGELYQVKLLVEPDGIRNRGFAFVTYMNAKLAENAMDGLRNKTFIGSNCLIMQKSVNNCRIFVGGLPTSKSKDEIWQELMSTYSITNIVDVITYRNYSNPANNRGFVFLEFRTHEEASYFRAKYSGKLSLFGKQLLVDWSVPVLETNENVMSQVKIIFLRNIDVTLPSEAFARHIYKLINRNVVEKVYKFKNYAYIHLNSRPNAEKLLDILNSVYAGTDVEVTWAKPPNRFSERSFRDKALVSRKAKSMVPPISIEQSRPSSPLLYGPDLVSSDITKKSQNFLSTGISPRTPASGFAPGSRLTNLSSQNIFINSDYGPNTFTVNNQSQQRLFGNFTVSDQRQPRSFGNITTNNQSQPGSSGNFVVPILPQNLTPFNQIQPFYQPRPFEMSSSRPISRTNMGNPSFSISPSRPTATPANTAIGLQDLEAMVSSLLTDS